MADSSASSVWVFVQKNVVEVGRIFKKYVGEEGLVPLHKLKSILKSIGVKLKEVDIEEWVQKLKQSEAFDLEELVKLLNSSMKHRRGSR